MGFHLHRVKFSPAAALQKKLRGQSQGKMVCRQKIREVKIREKRCLIREKSGNLPLEIWWPPCYGSFLFRGRSVIRNFLGGPKCWGDLHLWSIWGDLNVW